MTTKELAEMAASVAGGAGIGAALMYLFDPQQGSQRRQNVGDAAGNALSTTAEVLSDNWQAVSHKARNLADHLRETAGEIGERANAAASSASSSASEMAADVADHARAIGRSAMKSGRVHGSRAQSRMQDLLCPEDTHASYGTIALTTGGVVAALALGAGLMYFMDSSQGARRRELMREKAAEAANRASRAARTAREYVADQARRATAHAYAHSSEQDQTRHDGSGQSEAARPM